MRDLLLAAFVMCFIVLGMRSAFSSYLVWTWTAVVFPTAWVYGFMTQSRLNLLFALLTLVMLLIRKENLEPFRMNRTTVLILIFLGHASLCALFAIPGNPGNAVYYEVFVKSLALALLLPVVVTTRVRLHAFLAVLVVGFGFISGLEGLRSMYTLGAHPIRGIHVGMLSDNNHFAAGIVMFIPVALYMAQHSGVRLTRQLAWAVFAVAVFCVLGSRSRGGFLGLLIVGFCLIMVSRHRIRMLVLSGLLGALFVAYAPDDMTGRLDTIKTARSDDSSFRSRLIAWRISSAVAVDNPVLGGGFHAVQYSPTWQKYMNEPGLFVGVEMPPAEDFGRAAHSIYFEVLGDLGFVGLFMFLALLANAYFTLFRLSRITKGRADLKWARDLAFTLMLCLVGYNVSGAAVSLAYYEFAYILLMLVEVLRQLVGRQLSGSLSSPVPGLRLQDAK